MRTLLVLLILGAAGYYGWKYFNPPPQPEPPRRLAPPGTYFVVKPFNLTTPEGIHGFPLLKKVQLVREEPDLFIVTDGMAEASAPPSHFTNDLDEVDRIRASLPRPAQPEPSPAPPTATEKSLEKIAAQLETLRRDSEKMGLRLQYIRELRARGQRYDGLVDLEKEASEIDDKLLKNRTRIEELNLRRQHILRDLAQQQ
jgi:hypothetical protein